jgi:hypothetical protein
MVGDAVFTNRREVNKAWRYRESGEYVRELLVFDENCSLRAIAEYIVIVCDFALMELHVFRVKSLGTESLKTLFTITVLSEA